ncbi:putative ATP-citrate synthase subunit 1 [Venturia nashicola]|uniref:Putative ATP-citrate synthase subunit 1 n=1 Tax=Venturia nashicola TaxID=86259 RepID=A0A4Z1P9K0_9PEZI|nr:putative ATP-citrate synthase subunit 1 [Venturia nashicola]TLD34497.1 putative ATP-citrate synthase subunit 1 [Venturia nashicola]
MKSIAAIFSLFSLVCAAPLAQPQHQHGQAASTSKASMPADMAMPAAPPSSASGSSTVTPGKAQCEFSMFEKANLTHNHDVNTGKIKGGSTIVPYAPALMGSGCSPAWAVGGRPDDNTPTKTPADLKLSVWGGIA